MNKLVFLFFLSIPNFLWAKDFSTFVKDLVDLSVDNIIFLGAACASMFFVWNVIMFVRSDQDKSRHFLNRIVFTLGLLLVLVSFWGILSLLRSTFKDFNKTEKDFKFDEIYLE